MLTRVLSRVRCDASAQIAAIRKHKIHYLFILPYAMVYLLFTILPVGIAVFRSFTSFNIWKHRNSLSFRTTSACL